MTFIYPFLAISHSGGVNRTVSLIYAIDAGTTWKELPGPRDEEVARQGEQFAWMCGGQATL